MRDGVVEESIIVVTSPLNSFGKLHQVGHPARSPDCACSIPRTARPIIDSPSSTQHPTGEFVKYDRKQPTWKYQKGQDVRLVDWAVMRLSFMTLLSGLISSLGCAREGFALTSHEGSLKPDPVVMLTSRRIRVDESSTELLIGQVA